MFGLMLKSTHEKAVAVMRDANRKQLNTLLQQLEAERRMVATLQGRIARRDTSIATLTADKAAVENELRLEQAKAASKPAAKPGPDEINAISSPEASREFQEVMYDALNKRLRKVSADTTPAAKPAPGKAKAEAPKARRK